MQKDKMKGANLMAPPISIPLFSGLLFLGMMIMLEIGRAVGVKRRPQESEDERNSQVAVEGAVFALFGLLVAFTFSGAASRFNDKRALIGVEANAIGTSYLRLQLVSEEARPALQELFRQYVDSRLETYRRLPDVKAAALSMARSKELQDKIWTGAVAATLLPKSHPDAGKLLLPALNEMIDITTTRTVALQTHPPDIVYALLFSLGLFCSLLVGYRMALSPRRSWLHILTFVVITVFVVFVAIDVEYPRAGLFRLKTADQPLIEALESMK